MGLHYADIADHDHVDSSIKHCRILKERMRLLRTGTRDHVMKIGGGLHNLRIRVRPWLPVCQSR